MSFVPRNYWGGMMEESRKWPDDAVIALRATQQHHVQLSLMADNKANMLLGATFIVFTLAVGQSQSGGLSLPLTILAIFAFTSAVFAVLAVMPVTAPKKDGATNMLFFGGFSDMEEGEFIHRVLTTEFENQETVYRAMLRDIHQMGLVLGRKKFLYLGWAYRVFLLGLTLTLFFYLVEQFTGPLT